MELYEFTSLNKKLIEFTRTLKKLQQKQDKEQS
jgi:hypothetical protein